MKHYDHIQLCFFDPARLRSREMLDALTGALIGDGFRLALFSTESEWDTDPEFSLWFAHLYNREAPNYQALSAERKLELEQPGMTPRLEQTLQDFLSGKVKELTIQALGVSAKTAQLHFCLSVLTDLEGTDAGTSHSVVARNEALLAYWFERLPVLLYDTLHPDFVCLHTDYDYVFISSDLQKRTLPYLYVDNYFGPVLVPKIGRERLMTTPGAKVRELSDGGLFVRIEGDIDAACEHLGLISQAKAQ